MMDIRDDYRETSTYRHADPTEQEQLEAWKKHENISDVQMLLFMRLEDLRRTPSDEKKKGNKTAETMLVFSMIFFLICVSLKQNSMLLIASAIVIVNTGIYFSGITNPYSMAVKSIKKKLKEYPKVVPFEKWKSSHSE